MARENVRVSRTVAAPVARVFAVLADPRTHAAIDGTGWVREPADPAPLTGAGQVFRMAMNHANHPEGDYRVANQVQVFDPPRAISWQTGQQLDDGRLDLGGWEWRYDLAPAPDAAGTVVTLTYDWSAVSAQVREYIQFPPFAPEHLGNSLDHLAELVGADVRP